MFIVNDLIVLVHNDDLGFFLEARTNQLQRARRSILGFIDDLDTPTRLILPPLMIIPVSLVVMIVVMSMFMFMFLFNVVAAGRANTFIEC